MSVVKRRLANNKVIIKDQFGIFSYYICGIKKLKKIPMVGCKDLILNHDEDERVYKIYCGENRPWRDDWSEDYKVNLTRAEAKSIIRHFAKESRRCENKHNCLYHTYYGVKKKLMYGEHDYCMNNEGWKVIDI